jgi:hypothetical protein
MRSRPHIAGSKTRIRHGRDANNPKAATSTNSSKQTQILKNTSGGSTGPRRRARGRGTHLDKLGSPRVDPEQQAPPTRSPAPETSNGSAGGSAGRVLRFSGKWRSAGSPNPPALQFVSHSALPPTDGEHCARRGWVWGEIAASEGRRF